MQTLSGDVLTIPGARLVLRGLGFAPRTARVVHPVQQELALTSCAGGFEVRLPDVTVHTIVSIEG